MSPNVFIQICIYKQVIEIKYDVRYVDGCCMNKHSTEIGAFSAAKNSKYK